MRIAAAGLVALVFTASIIEYDIPTPRSAPHGIVAAPNGVIWFAEIGSNRLGRFDPRIERFKEWTIPTNGSRPYGLAWGGGGIATGRLYITEQAVGKIAVFDPRLETFTEYDVPTPGSGPGMIVEGPDSAIWFTEQRANRIGRLDPRTGQITEFPVPTPAANLAGIVAARAENAIYFAELEASKLGRLDIATGQIEEFPTPTTRSGVRQLAIDRTGGIWMTYYRAGKVARFDPATRTFREHDAPGGAQSAPFAIGVDTAGHVWFSQFALDLNDLVELDPASGRMTSVRIPSSPALVRQLTVDGRNSVWYANNAQGRIGRVVP
jgi:virginiamycin B lyase